jgi:hypothetical protein
LVVESLGGVAGRAGGHGHVRWSEKSRVFIVGIRVGVFFWASLLFIGFYVVTAVLKERLVTASLVMTKSLAPAGGNNYRRTAS